ncbi:MAG: hypothetical protein KAS32_24560 [Candidatus Peribacteraceae bacterium]|nr:hypothetical protein [Candidatus Peribacteraceae bacterium]
MSVLVKVLKHPIDYLSPGGKKLVGRPGTQVIIKTQTEFREYLAAGKIERVYKTKNDATVIQNVKNNTRLKKIVDKSRYQEDQAKTEETENTEELEETKLSEESLSALEVGDVLSANVNGELFEDGEIVNIETSGTFHVDFDEDDKSYRKIKPDQIVFIFGSVSE